MDTRQYHPAVTSRQSIPLQRHVCVSDSRFEWFSKRVAVTASSARMPRIQWIAPPTVCDGNAAPVRQIWSVVYIMESKWQRPEGVSEVRGQSSPPYLSMTSDLGS